MDISESEIIINCQKGDLKQFGILYDRYIKKIYDFIYFKTHHRETAEDLVSKTFHKVIKNIDGFTTDKGSFKAWLYRIARNTVIDHYRTKKKDLNIADVFDLSTNEDILKDLEAKEKLEEVEKYIKILKPEIRDILIMRLWQGMSYREIAEIVGKSEASSKMAFSRAIIKLRKEMPLVLFITLLSKLI